MQLMGGKSKQLYKHSDQSRTLSTFLEYGTTYLVYIYHCSV